MRKTRLLGAAVVLLLAAGCSSGSSTPGTTPVPAPSVSSSGPPAPAETSASPAPCPDGAYLVTALESKGGVSGTGTGGNIAADFTSGTFTISSDGSDPVTLDLGPVNAEMRFDGEISGTYAGDPGALELKTTGAHGDVDVKGFALSRTYSAGGLANQLIGTGATAQVTCDETAGAAVVVLLNASLTLTPVAR